MSDRPAAIRTDGLTKDFGRGHGVFDLDLVVREGEIFGYLGPNGAGKTTTIRLFLDLIRPTQGRATLLGLDARSDGVALRRRVGYVPGELSLYESLAGRELVSYFASLRGGAGRSEAETLASRLELDLSRQIRQLSKGNKQKVGLVLALMHGPELLLLDEPTSGLDPLAQEVVHELLRDAAAGGRTVFLSSHLLAEVERIAHRVGIVRAGRLVVVEEIGALKAKALRHLEFQFARPVSAAAFSGLPGVRLVHADGPWVRLEVEGEVDAAVKAAAAHEVVNVTSHEPDLEEIFLTYYRDGTDG